MIDRIAEIPGEYGPEKRRAQFSPCMNFRYSLTIRFPINMMWDRDKRVAWICMNPSTATETDDDPTIRRIKQFSQDWGFGNVTILNAYALRSTDPAGLKYVVDPKGGRECDEVIDAYCAPAEQIILAWGTGAVTTARRDELFGLLWEFREKVFALGVNKDGSPKHPLYISGKTAPERYLFENPNAHIDSPVSPEAVSEAPGVGAGEAEDPLQVLRG